MSPARFVCCLLTAGALLAPSSVQAQDGARAKSVDAGFQKFWAAASPAEAALAAAALIEAGITFDEAWQRLKTGRTYVPQPSGVVMRSNRSPDGIEHNYAVNVPPGYDPARRYQVRFQLHGGIGGRADNKPRGTGEIGPLAGAEQFYVLPYAWADSPWWSSDEVLNLNAIVDSLKRTYNIDENRVVVAGVSDGATGAYYIAMHDTTSYASFLPLNGFIMVLANGEIDDGRIFPNNLRNKPLFVVNGGRDRLYPTGIVEPFTHHLRSGGVQIDYHPQPEGEHNTKWWSELKDTFEQFVADHPRDPHPDTLTWDAADPQGHATHNRAHWLVLDEFGPARGEAARVPDVNMVAPSENEVFPETEGLLFGRDRSAGHVDLVRTGNTVQAVTKGVTAFSLLLSPDKFDFRQPVKVVANGREVFNGMVSPSVKTLLTWAARDNDRTMLYGAELHIKLTQ
jgi:hypothetical protein